jgi:hypothetical protein
MASIDLSADYKLAKDKISATKAYTDLKSQYDSIQRKAGDSFEQAQESVVNQIDKVKEESKKYQRQIKSQFEQLLDINNVTGGKGSNSMRYIKRLLIKSLKNIQPKITELLLQESINAVGCDEQQVFEQQTIYVKVKSIDLGNLLKKDPNSQSGKVLYEKENISIQNYPFAMNKELYNRVQNENLSFATQYGSLYKGESTQSLFDVTFVELDDTFQTGPWFKIDLQNRVNGPNKVGQFLVDYYKTVEPVQFTNIMANIMNSLSGAISINASVGLIEIEDATKFEILLQRILGLCFDNRETIDVSGIAKISEIDGVDESFFEFTDIDLRNIELKSANVFNGVVEFLDCTTAKLPVNSLDIINALNELNFVEGNKLEDVADNLTNVLTQNPNWQGIGIGANINAAVDLNFIKLIVQGLAFALLGPKVLLPIFVMLKAIGQSAIDGINGFVDFMKQFKKFIINLISKIGALFVQELFELIKKDILNLVQVVISDLKKELQNKKIIMILKLVQLLLLVAQFVSDWRQCRSVIDEILWLLKVTTGGLVSRIPLPLLFASQLLEGYSETRAFIGTIQELESLGIPTGPMPDGGPNLHVLSILAQLKAQAAEEAENGKVQIAVPPLTITPAGLTVPQGAFGKKF